MVKLSVGTSSSSKTKSRFGKSSSSSSSSSRPSMYRCDAKDGCERDRNGKHSSIFDCRADCARDYWRCDKDKGCVPAYSDLLTVEQRAQQGIFETKADCQAQCAAYYRCDCKSKCVPVHNTAPVVAGETSPRPGEYFALTEQGRKECQETRFCTEQPTCGLAGTVAIIIVVSIVGICMLALLTYFLVRFVKQYRAEHSALGSVASKKPSFSIDF